MYRVTHIITSVDNPRYSIPVVKDENNRLYTGEMEKIGFLWKIGNQYFDHEGHEVKKDPSIATIDEHIHSIAGSETRDLFFATTVSGKKTIIKTDYYIRNEPIIYEIKKDNLKRYPDIRFTPFAIGLEIISLPIEGAFFEVPSDWILLKTISGYQFMHIPSWTPLKYEIVRDRKILTRPSANNSMQNTKTYFKKIPEFFIHPYLGKCMKTGAYQTDEGVAKKALHNTVMQFYPV